MYLRISVVCSGAKENGVQLDFSDHAEFKIRFDKA